ncbi:helicase-exonuclease AddAB subunit AddA [Anaerobium acetethylicum]|uniref:ATP-dependent helicase/nuclease subunit A n=1 Tax=Anaerobium acetethylicum TaxID=1619234 RepID=A0A1D3TXV9_9FIRM|nr:helicase-exonuclease AddAB subunit AddA [Anaerobium acetethylicum]SCP99204.1 DNA helicase/exodeoxyribonuclease V, subunit A [Anaerobium acetethylicum]
MGTKWTEEQQKVIDLRNRNMLVSAAAGSGKTAVLVERIIKMITDKDAPVDIDRLLVVTFTNAAAAEMRERVSSAIEKKLEEDPKDSMLQRQLTLIHNAQITTIHSFCLYVIRNNFHVIDLDPGFRVADEGELKLMKSDIAEGLLEDCYEEGREEFYHFIECYSPGKTDSGIEELILQLYQFSMSYPWPEEWLENCKKAYEADSLADIGESVWMKKLLEHAGLILADAKQSIRSGRELSLTPDGPYMYEDAWNSDEELLDAIMRSTTYSEYYEAFAKLEYAKLSGKKDPGVSQYKREAAKNMRDGVKDSLKSLKNQYFSQSPSQMLENIRNAGAAVNELIDLTLEFSKRFSQKKMEKNLVDFNDLEHFALKILVDENGGDPVPTAVAEDLSGYFSEIMIDEYQDSNFVQEMILTSVSKAARGIFNIFMVGDVKQSIYKFRLARPELFMEKYENYSQDDSDHQRIDLHKNFRSRCQVLDGINFIFYQIMGRTLGNIEYDKDSALYNGAVFPEGSPEELLDTELLLVDLNPEDLEETDEEYTSREIEAKAVAKRIKELVAENSDFRVLDKKTGAYRKCRYSDIVILLRTVSGWGDTFAEILMSADIPAYTGSQTGYFSTIEIRTILALLNVIDNPIQDIPLAAVLKSPIVGLSTEELAIIKSTYPGSNLYDGALRYSMFAELGETEAEKGKQEESGSAGSDMLTEISNSELAGKLSKFFEQLDEFRRLVPYTGIHDLIWIILEKTGYGSYVAAMPGGEQRKANVDMLVEKAIVFESASYRGLFNFVRYIEQLQKYDVDFGEAGTISENENTVRIMSIHKSKGLEFPVVFVSGLGKRFNRQDARSRLVLHPDLGVGADFIDPELRVKSPTLIKKAMQQQIDLENMGEELRVLYVALTRAKEKLIMTGAVKKIEDKISSFAQVLVQPETRIPFSRLSKAQTFLEWIIPALMRHRSFGEILESLELPSGNGHSLCGDNSKFSIKLISIEEVIGQEVMDQFMRETTREDLMNWDADVIYRKEAREKLEERLGYQYPFSSEAGIHTKMSVSELKKIGQNIDDELTEQFYEEPPLEPLIPRFIEEKEEAGGTERGTAYHKILQYLELPKISSRESLEENLNQLIAKGRFTEETGSLVKYDSLFRFASSPLGSRMRQADLRDELYREQPFVIGIEAKEMNPEFTSDELILIQGIIDAYFEEDGQLVVADYKTDRVRIFGKDAEEELKRRYKIQLDYYQKALEQLTGKKVKEKIIYSFDLQKEIVI